MKWLKRWVHRAVHDFDTRADNTSRMVDEMASAVCVVHEIDNGFLVRVGSNRHSHSGERMALMYCEDAAAVANAITVHKAKLRIATGMEYGNAVPMALKQAPMPHPPQGLVAKYLNP